MKLADNRQQWINRVKAYRSSGMKSKEWCEKENLKKSSLSYWITKLNKEERVKKNPSSFVKVIPEPEIETTVPSCLTLHVNQFSLDIPSSFDAHSLKKLIGVLREC